MSKCKHYYITGKGIDKRHRCRYIEKYIQINMVITITVCVKCKGQKKNCAFKYPQGEWFK